MSLPYFPMYPSDFEAKTSHLTLEEDGAYNRLLRLCWMTPDCSLPDDAAWIARRMRVDMDTFNCVVAPLIDEFFVRAKGRVFSPKLKGIYSEASDKHERRVEAGKKGGRPAKALEKNENAESKAKAMPKQPEPEPEPEYSDTDVSGGDAAEAPAGEEIEGLDLGGDEPPKQDEPDFEDDLAKELFGRGVRYLTRHGIAEANARRVIGLWRKNHSDSDILSAFMACAKSGAVDPIPWITARLIPPPTFKPDFSKYGVS